MFLWAFAYSLGGCSQPQREDPSTIKRLEKLEAVRNDRIAFATMRAPDARLPTLQRRIVVTGPPELVELTHAGDSRVLDELVPFLQEPDRGWAAVVLLAAMTRREDDVVNAFATRPQEWWATVVQPAHARWAAWLTDARARLHWDPQEKVFTEQQ